MIIDGVTRRIAGGVTRMIPDRVTALIAGVVTIRNWVILYLTGLNYYGHLKGF